MDVMLAPAYFSNRDGLHYGGTEFPDQIGMADGVLEGQECRAFQSDVQPEVGDRYFGFSHKLGSMSGQSAGDARDQQILALQQVAAQDDQRGVEEHDQVRKPQPQRLARPA